MARLLIFPNFCTCSLLAVGGLPVLGAATVGAGDGRCCYWYRSASSLVVTSAAHQASQQATLSLSHQLIGFVVYRAPLLPV